MSKIHEWDDVVADFSPAKDLKRKVRIVFISSYEALLIHRANIVMQNVTNPLLKPELNVRLMHNLYWATSEKKARAAFEEFEIEIVGQLDDIAHAAFVGPDNDATAEDMIHSDGYNEHDDD